MKPIQYGMKFSTEMIFTLYFSLEAFCRKNRLEREKARNGWRSPFWRYTPLGRHIWKGVIVARHEDKRKAFRFHVFRRGVFLNAAQGVGIMLVLVWTREECIGIWINWILSEYVPKDISPTSDCAILKRVRYFELRTFANRPGVFCWFLVYLRPQVTRY